MLTLHVDPKSELPIYHQIVEQVCHAVASGQVGPGYRLPTVRQLAIELDVHHNTVAHAYAQLEREGVLACRPGRGSFISAARDDKGILAEREAKLQSIVGRAALEALSLGYSPDQLEAAFALCLAKWREAAQPAQNVATQGFLAADAIDFVGSHDLTLDLLAAHLRRRRPPVKMTSLHVGSLAGLIALARGEAHVAGCHLLDEETGEYNLPFVKRLLPGQKVVLINLVHRTQGLMLPKGNPKGISGLRDLARPDVTFVNRQRGSGTRVLLDHELHKAGIVADAIKGYEHEETTHLGVAAAVSGGTADVGLGILAAARAMELDFVPLWQERYDLVILRASYEAPPLQPLLETIRDAAFRGVVQELGGYDTSAMGQIVGKT